MPLQVSVNLSVQNLLDPEFPAQVSRLLRRWDVAPEWLKLEVTEHSAMSDPDVAGRTLRELSAIGIRLAIDDFGTGYSSLGHLQHLPVDEIKIDKSFVMSLSQALNDADDSLLPALVGFARQLGLSIVAEGVESPEAWSRLAQYGCDFVQGYYLGRPTASPEFGAWLRRRAAEEPVPVPAHAPALHVAGGGRPMSVSAPGGV
jgi:diguanylate cyclase